MEPTQDVCVRGRAVASPESFNVCLLDKVLSSGGPVTQSQGMGKFKRQATLISGIPTSMSPHKVKHFEHRSGFLKLLKKNHRTLQMGLLPLDIGFASHNIMKPKVSNKNIIPHSIAGK